MLLFLALLIIPFIDLYLLLLIGREIGFWPTVGLVLISGLIGALLARKEGLRVLRRWLESVMQGRMPEEGLLGGVLILMGGVLLMMPGVLTDGVGLLLLFPPTRRLVAAGMRRSLERRLAEGTVRVTTFQSGPFTGGPFGAPPPDDSFARPAPRPPRMERRSTDEVDAEFTEEDGRE